GLSDELVEPLVRHRAVALFVHVPAASIARRLTVNEHAESYRRSSGERSHDQMQVARMKPIADASVRFIEGYEARGYRPIAAKRPLIEPQRRRRSIGSGLADERTARRCKAVRLLTAEIILLLSQIV